MYLVIKHIIYNILFIILKPFIYLIYRFLEFIHFQLYKLRILKSKKAKNYIISVGNISFGGTGKTPFVHYLFNLLLKNNITSTVLTRGYKSESSKEIKILNKETVDQHPWSYFGDEACMLFNQQPEMTIYVHANRAKSSALAEEIFPVSILDDGKQHYKLKKNLEITLIDASVSLSDYKLFPFGKLRTPLTRLQDSDIIVFTKVLPKNKREVWFAFKKYLHNKKVFYCDYKISHLIDENKKIKKLNYIRNKAILLLCGIANPHFLLEQLNEMEYGVMHRLEFPDHYAFKKEDIELIKKLSSRFKHCVILTTEKDWVRLKEYKNLLPKKIYQLVAELHLPEEFDHLIINNIKNSNV